MREGLPEAERSGGVADGEIDACSGTCGVLGKINGGQCLFDEVTERVLHIRKHLVAHHVLLPTLLLHLHIGRLYSHIHQKTEQHQLHTWTAWGAFTVPRKINVRKAGDGAAGRVMYFGSIG
jgi:hypothetical protein